LPASILRQLTTLTIPDDLGAPLHRDRCGRGGFAAAWLRRQFL